MKISIRKGLGFGLTSGIITTLGVIIGLNSTASSKTIIIGGILIVAIADALSDALGIHIAEEAGRKKTHKEVWESTASTFFFKLIFALSFILPILFFSLTTAILVSVVWGFLLLGFFSFYIAKVRKSNPYRSMAEHLFIAFIVVIIAHFVGIFVRTYFG